MLILITVMMMMIIIIKRFPAHEELGTCRTSHVSLGLVCQHAIGRKHWHHQCKDCVGM